MSEELPRYGQNQPEYFFLHRPTGIVRIRVPFLYVQAVLDIIGSPQGKLEHSISHGYIPGPVRVTEVSTGTMDHLLRMAEEEGWYD